MTDLAAFLTARLNAEQQLAEWAAKPHGGSREPGDATMWQVEKWVPSEHEEGAVPAAIWVVDRSEMGIGQMRPDRGIASHIAYWDPARVLAEIAAKRRVLARHQRMGSVYRDALVPDACEGCGLDEGEWNVADINECPELLDLAAPFSGHEDFDESWRT